MARSSAAPVLQLSPDLPCLGSDIRGASPNMRPWDARSTGLRAARSNSHYLGGCASCKPDGIPCRHISVGMYADKAGASHAADRRRSCP